LFVLFLCVIFLVQLFNLFPGFVFLNYSKVIKQPQASGLGGDFEGLSVDGVGSGGAGGAGGAGGGSQQAQDDAAYLSGRNRSLPNLSKQNGENGHLSARG
jgi:hypothetical protein